jgi:isopropylmalate/homocitrate/citramalate synthase
MEDARLAVETGVDGLDVVIGTSSFLREHSHGKDMAYITKTALEVIEYIKSKGLEVRCEFTIQSLQTSSKFHIQPRNLVVLPVSQMPSRH